MQKYAKNSKGQKKFVFFLAIKKLFPRPAKPSEGRALYIYITIYLVTFLPSTIYRPLPIALMSLPMTRPSIE